MKLLLCETFAYVGFYILSKKIKNLLKRISYRCAEHMSVKIPIPFWSVWW